MRHENTLLLEKLKLIYTTRPQNTIIINQLSRLCEK